MAAAWGDGGALSAADLGRALWALDPWLPAEGPGCPPASPSAAEADAGGAGGLPFDGIWGRADVAGGACPLYLGGAAPEWAAPPQGGRPPKRLNKRERVPWEASAGPPAGLTICPAGVMGTFCPPPALDAPRKHARSYGDVLRNHHQAGGLPPPGPRPPRTPPVAVPGQPLSGLGTRCTIQPFNGLNAPKEDALGVHLSVEDVNQRVQATAPPPEEGEALPNTPPNCHPPRYLAAALTPVPLGWAS